MTTMTVASSGTDVSAPKYIRAERSAGRRRVRMPGRAASGAIRNRTRITSGAVSSSSHGVKASRSAYCSWTSAKSAAEP